MLTKIPFAILLVITASIGAAAQTAPAPQATPNQYAEVTQRSMDEARRQARMAMMESLRAPRKPVPAQIHYELMQLYRNADAREKKLLEPAEEDLAGYRSFLQQPRTGIVRLVPDARCGDGTSVIAATETCLKYTMPGHGSSFSFRAGEYRIDRLADIRLLDGQFVVAGQLQHGILTAVPGLDIRTLNDSSQGLAFLRKFRPSRDLENASQVGRQLAAATESDGLIYAPAVRAVEGTTYLIRCVAYRGTVLREFKGFMYDEIDFDKRVDVTAAFKVVRAHPDGGVTIVWKLLAESKSPKLGAAKARSDSGK